MIQWNAGVSIRKTNNGGAGKGGRRRDPTGPSGTSEGGTSKHLRVFPAELALPEQQCVRGWTRVTALRVVVLLLVLSVRAAGAADFSTAAQLYERGDYEGAFEQWQALAN